MTIRKQPTLSQENIDSIIDMVAPEAVNSQEYVALTAQQAETLRSFSLVSQKCCLRARKHIFSHIRFKLDDKSTPNVTSLHHFMQILQANKHGVRECPRLLELEVNQEFLENQVLVRILVWLPQLRVLKIGCQFVPGGSSIDCDKISEEAETALRNLPKTSPRLEILELNNFTNMDVDFVLGWNGIRKLTLRDCRFFESPSEGQSDEEDGHNTESFSCLQHLHVLGRLTPTLLGALVEKKAPNCPSLQSLAVEIPSSFNEEPLWCFLSSPWVQSLETLKIDRQGDFGWRKTSRNIRLPSLTSLNLQVHAGEGDYVEFKEILALGTDQSALKTLTVRVEVELEAREFVSLPDGAWEIGFAWDELDLALASPCFPCIKDVTFEVNFVLQHDGSCDREECEMYAHEMADLITGYHLFPQLADRIDLEFDTTIRWSDK